MVVGGVVMAVVMVACVDGHVWVVMAVVMGACGDGCVWVVGMARMLDVGCWVLDGELMTRADGPCGGHVWACGLWAWDN